MSHKDLPLRLELVGDGPMPSEARWAGGRTVAPPDDEHRRAMEWAWWAFAQARSRVSGNRMEGRASWVAAVEAVWWVSALNDALRHHIGARRYDAAREDDDAGRVVKATMWLRHRHIHEVAITGVGGAKRPFFPGPGDNYFLFVSPSNRWLSREQIRADHERVDLDQRADYDQYLAGKPIEQTMDQCRAWFDRVFSACAWAPFVEPDDRTIL